MSFGQGIGVTAIQMASVYATIANGGVRVQPTHRGRDDQRRGPVHARRRSRPSGG